MTLETVPLLREDSILCWEIESIFKTAPAAATWQSLGRVESWADLGPVKPISRQVIAGSGREAANTHVQGTAYPPTAIGPFQVVDPRFLGFPFGQEVGAPTALGGGYYRHAATATQNGRLPSMAMQMGDYKKGVLTDGQTYLGVVMPRLGLRGEEVGEDGTGGRVLATPTFLPHDDSIAVAGKAISLPSSEPYKMEHASITFFSDLDWRIHSWEATVDNHVIQNYYHRSTDAGKPFEAPPADISYDLTMDIIADGHQNPSGKLIRDLVRDEVEGNVTLKYVRTANQDEFELDLAGVRLESALKDRTRGKIHYQVKAVARAGIFQWVDQNSARYFPA